MHQCYVSYTTKRWKKPVKVGPFKDKKEAKAFLQFFRQYFKNKKVDIELRNPEKCIPANKDA